VLGLPENNGNGQIRARKLMTKADLYELVRQRLDLPRSEAVRIIEHRLELLKETFILGDPLVISNFGKFYVRQKRTRIGRNPQTGEPLEITARRVIHFRPSPGLKAMVNATRPDDPPAQGA
jgi:integration host factor subunit alpha